MRINGPYRHTTGPQKGRAYVNIVKKDGSKTTKLYSRYLMEERLGRKLGYDETVDHIDEDPTNDSLDNLQILSRAENARKSRANDDIETRQFECPWCEDAFAAKMSQVRNNQGNQGKAGPFCGQSCAGKYGAAVQNGRWEGGTEPA